MKLLKDTLPGMLRQLANDIEMGSASGAPVLDDVNFRVKGTATTRAAVEFNREEPSPAQGVESRPVLRIEAINRRCLPTHRKARALPPLGVGRHLGLA